MRNYFIQKNVHEIQGDNTSLQHIGLLNLAHAY